MLFSNLKSHRTYHKTQQDVLEILFTRQGYANYENNIGGPDKNTLVKLADYFEVATDYILR